MQNYHSCLYLYCQLIRLMFFDSHTHHPKIHSVINLKLNEDSITGPYIYSVGIHPWFINEPNLQNQFNWVEKVSNEKYIAAIGECGIDRAIKTPINQQKEIFIWHLNLAEKLNMPIIIHCVRAFSDIIEVLVQTKFKGILIFHDYRGNTIQTEKLNQFNCYYSFGKSIVQPNQKLQNTFLRIPNDQILLETDDSEFSIEKIYICAAKLLNIQPEKLEQVIWSNVERIYGKCLVNKN